MNHPEKYPKFNITKFDVRIFILFLISLPVWTIYLGRGFSCMALLYAYGFCFEMITWKCWIYSKEACSSSFVLRDRPVNLIYGLGWIGIVGLGLGLTQLIQNTWSLGVYTSVALGCGVVGIIVEKLYLEMGLWKYNLEHPWVRLGFKRMPVWGGLPVSVIGGYFFFLGTMVYLIVHYGCDVLLACKA
jgi:hypothetical protein